MSEEDYKRLLARVKYELTEPFDGGDRVTPVPPFEDVLVEEITRDVLADLLADSAAVQEEFTDTTPEDAE
jgi:hypothetical protein